MKATIIPDLCGSCGVCVDVCPEVFELDDDGLAVVKTDPVPSEHEAATREAADGCPTDAIEIEE